MNLPWYSVDSSGFSAAYRFARLSLFDPAKGQSVAIALDGKDIYKHIDLLKRVYKVDPEEVKLSTPDRRRQLVRLAIASVQQTEDFLRARHKVTPPSYGVNGFEVAPSVHVALGFPQAQSTLAVSPTDTPAPIAGPNIHAAMRTDETKLVKPVGPSVHFVDGSATHLKMGSPLGPSVHVADSAWDNFAQAKETKE